MGQIKDTKSKSATKKKKSKGWQEVKKEKIRMAGLVVQSAANHVSDFTV